MDKLSGKVPVEQASYAQEKSGCTQNPDHPPLVGRLVFFTFSVSREWLLESLFLLYVARYRKEDNLKHASWKGEPHEAIPTDHPCGCKNHLCRSLAVGSGTRTSARPYRSPFCSPGTPSPSAGLLARHRQFHRAQKWLATGTTRWRISAIR